MSVGATKTFKSPNDCKNMNLGADSPNGKNRIHIELGERVTIQYLESHLRSRGFIKVESSDPRRPRWEYYLGLDRLNTLVGGAALTLTYHDCEAYIKEGRFPNLALACWDGLKETREIMRKEYVELLNIFSDKLAVKKRRHVFGYGSP